MPPGQPTLYRKEYAKQAKKLARLGATDIQLADFFDVSVRTIVQWKITHEEFSRSLKGGKDELDANIEQSLYHRAMGFERDSVKIFLNKQGEPVTVPFREVVPPDTTACIFWLKNRQKDRWRDKTEVENSGSVGVQLIHDIPRPKREE
jgi:hypothetical protein